MALNDRCLMVHGHFYQPPRESPWTGKIVPQESAAPWENWNCRIADECYLPMARSRVYDADGMITDLYNNYAHTSFNFGPTLLRWMQDVHPEFIRHINDALVINRTFGLAQVYNHMMLPLADERDRHTQIIWGLREFHSRFGFWPAGMWLSECGINQDTVRVLIDHGVRYVILSPHQCALVRPFGTPDWTDVRPGAVETRRAYRIFETDGAGRTHFNRWIDAVFYTPNLNLKVSFDHILNDSERLTTELENCYNPDSDEAQLVCIVTDGEIYGHHEKKGETALTRLYRDIAPALGLKVVSAGEFVRDNPPTWEAKLWEGVDGRGSSWSCDHGVGRWHTDCGCTSPSPAGWNQKWRGPLRAAFDALRDRVRAIARRELGSILRDVDEARNDYISLVLNPAQAARRAFTQRHAQHPPAAAEAERLWRLMEALRYTMLMYTSCGWFFNEISGLEPVQDMCYALRAAELAQPYADEDLTAVLQRELAAAQPNIADYADGADVFRKLVLPESHTNQELTAALAVCLAADFPTDVLDWEIVNRADNALVVRDPHTDRFIRARYSVLLDDIDTAGVYFHSYEEMQGNPLRADDAPLLQAQEAPAGSRPDTGVPAHRLPRAVRTMVYRRLAARDEDQLVNAHAELGRNALPFIARARKFGAAVPGAVIDAATRSLAQTIGQEVLACIADADAATHTQAIRAAQQQARDLYLNPDTGGPAQNLVLASLETLWLLRGLDAPEWPADITLPNGTPWAPPRSPFAHAIAYPTAGDLAQALGCGLARTKAHITGSAGVAGIPWYKIPLVGMLRLARDLGARLDAVPALGMLYWEFMDRALPRLAPDGTQPSSPRGEFLLALGQELGFDPGVIRARMAAK